MRFPSIFDHARAFRARAHRGRRIERHAIVCLLHCAIILVLVLATGCALPPPQAPSPTEMHGVLSTVNVQGRFFSLESRIDGRTRPIYWDDSTDFFHEGRKVNSSDVGALLGERIDVLAVPIGRKMVANQVTSPSPYGL